MFRTAVLTAAGIVVLVLLVGERRPETPVVAPGESAEGAMARDGARPGEAPRAVPPARVQAPRTGREEAPAPPRRLAFRVQDPLAGRPEAEAHPNRAEIRRATWDSLVTFSKDAELTEAQWQQFLGDLSDLGATDQKLYWEDWPELTSEERMAARKELGDELRARVAAYFTERQRALFEATFLPENIVFMVGAGHVLEVQAGDVPPEPYKGPRLREPRG